MSYRHVQQNMSQILRQIHFHIFVHSRFVEGVVDAGEREAPLDFFTNLIPVEDVPITSMNTRHIPIKGKNISVFVNNLINLYQSTPGNICRDTPNVSISCYSY
jgi:hypothetical protein